MWDFRILGPLEVRWHGAPVALPRVGSRRVLAVLLLRECDWCPREVLVDDLWENDPPHNPRKALQMQISRLRRALPDANAIKTGEAGYRLAVPRDAVDRTRFEGLIADAREQLASGEPRRAGAIAQEALRLWRGPPLVELTLTGWPAATVARLDELRLTALELRAEAALELGELDAAIEQLQQLLDEHPWRERVHAKLMLALYRSGRQVDALQAFQNTRARFVEELGIEPGVELRSLQQAILRQCPELGAGPDPPRLNGSSRVPRPATPLLGREAELAKAASLVGRDDVRLVTLTGPGGVGKTRLALALATRAPGPTAWVDLAGIARAEGVPAALLRTVDAEPLARESSEDALVRFLVPKELLLIVDNVEHVLDIAPLIGRIVAEASGVTVLATSREPLGLSVEHRYHVPPLAPDDAVALFEQLASRRGLDFELTPAVSEICDKLDRLPLAIELAAARTALFTPEQLLARLGDVLSALGHGPRDAPARQRTLRATIEWSHALLDKDQRAAFAAFSVFAGGAEPDAAELVTAAAPDTLQALVDKQLIQRSDGRLAMLETVRAFGLELLADQTRDRHLEYFLALAEHAQPHLHTDQEPRWLLRLDCDVDNVRAALNWAVVHRPALALRLAGVLGRYWYVRSVAEGRRWLEAALAAAGEGAPAHDRATAYSELAFHLNSVMIDGSPAARRALQIAQDIGDRRLQSAARLALAFAASSLHGDERTARVLAEQALADASAAGDLWRTAMAHHLLATLLPREAGAPHAEEAANRLRRIGNRWHHATLYSNLAYNAIRERRYDDAQSLLDKAVPLLDANHPRVAAIVSGNLGLVRLLGGRPREAVAPLLAELRFAAKQVSPGLAAEALGGLAGVAAASGDHERCAFLVGAVGQLHPGPDPSIADELERRLYAPARAALGEARWCALSRAGSDLTLVDAAERAFRFLDDTGIKIERSVGRPS